MMSFNKLIRTLGYLMTAYSLLKALGLVKATVLERILTENQHADTNKLLIDGKFGSSFEEIAYHIGIKAEDVENSMQELQKIGLINFEIDNEFVIIKVNKEAIINFVKINEKRYLYKPWNDGLYILQEDAAKHIEQTAHRRVDESF